MKYHCLLRSILIISDLPDDDIEKITISYPLINPYIIPPIIPEKPRRISQSSSILSIPITIDKILYQATIIIPINTTPERLGARYKRLGFQFLMDEYRKFHQSRRDSNPVIEELSEEKINTWINRLIHMIDLLILSPPSNTVYFMDERTRILSLIFIKDKMFLSFTSEIDFY
jgi:hypothetical protein